MSRTKPDTGETKMIVYGHDFCSQARGLIHVLNRHEIDYEYRDVVSGKPKWKKELKRAGVCGQISQLVRKRQMRER